MTTEPRHVSLRRLICLAAAWLCAVPATADSEADLAATLRALTGRSIALANAEIGVHVRDLRSGREVFSHHADEQLIPASNLKLITTGAALVTLGVDHTFDTSFEITDNALVVVGSGDPGLADAALLERSTPPMTVDGLLDSVVDAVRKAGVTAVDEVIIDDRVFDRELVHPSWPADQLNRWYCAGVSGLNFATNCVTFEVLPSRSGPGHAPSVSLIPEAGWLEWTNRAKTVSKGRTTAWVARPRPANVFTVFGDVHRRAPALVDVALHEPQLFTGRLLADRLAKAGVTVGGHSVASRAVRQARLAEPDERFDDARPVAVVRTALRDALHRSNVNSQNLYTEALLKATGHAVTGEPGSWANGAAVVRMIITERLDPAHARSLNIADGSGLSRLNRISPETLTAWIASIATDEELGDTYVESLPMPGEGTLRSRFRSIQLDSIVRAKSGSINGVRCLSGLVISPRTGRSLAFSVLLNDLKSTNAVRGATKYHEQVVDAIDDWLVETDATYVNADEGESGFGG